MLGGLLSSRVECTQSELSLPLSLDSRPLTLCALFSLVAVMAVLALQYSFARGLRPPRHVYVDVGGNVGDSVAAFINVGVPYRGSPALVTSLTQFTFSSRTLRLLTATSATVAGAMRSSSSPRQRLRMTACCRFWARTSAVLLKQ
jgi:hypothetical protein